jgi:acid phosphatase family membrane protein YuiD
MLHSNFVYLVAPFVGWLVAGSLKFAINSLRSRGPAWKQIGYGGFPSTHSTIVTTTAALVGFREGFDTPAFAIAATLAFIVMLDAATLRRQIGGHARALNSLLERDPRDVLFRERMGHGWPEVLAGAALGVVCAFVLGY